MAFCTPREWLRNIPTQEVSGDNPLCPDCCCDRCSCDDPACPDVIIEAPIGRFGRGRDRDRCEEEEEQCTPIGCCGPRMPDFLVSNR